MDQTSRAHTRAHSQIKASHTHTNGHTLLGASVSEMKELGTEAEKERKQCFQARLVKTPLS